MPSQLPATEFKPLSAESGQQALDHIQWMIDSDFGSQIGLVLVTRTRIVALTQISRFNFSCQRRKPEGDGERIEAKLFSLALQNRQEFETILDQVLREGGTVTIAEVRQKTGRTDDRHRAISAPPSPSAPSPSLPPPPPKPPAERTPGEELARDFVDKRKRSLTVRVSESQEKGLRAIGADLEVEGWTITIDRTEAGGESGRKSVTIALTAVPPKIIRDVKKLTAICDAILALKVGKKKEMA